MNQKWGIIGGGIMGMTLAHRLAQRGGQVTLFDTAPDLGGLASAWKINNFTWDKFYHVISLSDLHTRKILNELKLEDKINWAETKTGFFTEGKLYSMSNTLEFLLFPPLNLIDKFRLGLTIFTASKIRDPQKLEKIPVAQWLQQWSGKNTFHKIWLPLLRAKLGESYQQTSAAFIWATIQRMYAARRSGLKKEMFGYVQGGYAQVLNSFKNMLKSEGVIINTKHSASEIKTTPNSKPAVTFSNGHEECFDQVIITLPSGTAADLCKGMAEQEIKKLKNIEYIGVICVSVILDHQISPYYVTNITDAWVPFTGIIEMTSLVDKKYFDGYTLVYLPKYLHPSDPLFEAPDATIEKLFLPSLRKMHPDISENNIKHVKIARVKQVFALTTLDYSKHLPGIQTSVPGVYIINSAHIINGTLNVNETIKIAEAKLNEILNQR